MAELASLESQLKSNGKKGKKVDQKRQAETAMFQNDIQVLRKRVQDYEGHIKRLKMYVDREDTDALV